MDPIAQFKENARQGWVSFAPLETFTGLAAPRLVRFAAFAPGARDPGELDEARDLLRAFAAIRARTAVAVLARSLEEIRLRPYVVEALAAIGDARAKDAVLAAFTSERYVHVRPIEARALVRLGAREEIRAPLARFAGVPEPMTEAIAIALDAGLLREGSGGAAWTARPSETAHAVLRATAQGPKRLFVLVGEGPGELGIGVDGVAPPLAAKRTGNVWVAELGDRAPGPVAVELTDPAGLRAAWVVPHAEEIPLPPPRQWDAGPDEPPQQ